MDIIARVAFGIDAQTQSPHECNRESRFIHFCRKALNFTFTDYKLILDVEEILQRTIFDNDCNEFFKSIATTIAQQRRKKPRLENPDFIQHLLNAAHGEEYFKTDNRQNSSPTTKEIHLSDMELAGQCFLFLIAGYETSASTLQFALFALTTNPTAQEEAYREIMEVVGHKEIVTYEDLSSMHYLEQIMMETLRMYPPAPRFDRECSSPITINHIHFQQNSIVSIPVFAIHYNPKIYPNPHKFDPMRYATFQ
ncbi:unnamed protein product [Anisakis simplex]|uniref:Cytochrome P450 n=1 Tax=Anisakis simplex TaxID=6269 RepID=A0A0M3K3M9_ANISI|nr:unnamed protein product [Anisakis simplex]